MAAGVQFINNAVRIKKSLKDKGIAWVYEACGELEAQTKRNAKVVTGKTKGSYHYHVDEDGLEGVVGTSSPNALWEEFGTGEYALNHDGRKGGWYYVDEQGKGHFTRGKHPKRPMFRAFTALKNKLIQHARQIFGGA